MCQHKTYTRRRTEEDTPESPHREDKAREASVYRCEDSEGPSEWRTGHGLECTMAASSSLQGRLQMGHGQRLMGDVTNDRSLWRRDLHPGL